MRKKERIKPRIQKPIDLKLAPSFVNLFSVKVGLLSKGKKFVLSPSNKLKLLSSIMVADITSNIDPCR